VIGVSRVPNTTREDCIAKGGGKFFVVQENGFQTPDATFTVGAGTADPARVEA